MSETILQCVNLQKSFREGGLSVDVLKGVDLQINAGEQIAIIGSSGSGKSTLLHLLGGLDTPTQGEVWVAGKLMSSHSNVAIKEHFTLWKRLFAKRKPLEQSLTIQQQSQWRNKHLGFVYQFHHLLPEFTALENVCMPLLIQGLSTKVCQERASAILSEVGLANRLAHKPGELSGGERQRAAVARALVTEPLCVLADEPTGNLDPRTAEQVYERMLVLNQHRKASLVVVTHDPALTQRMDRTLQLVEGQLTEVVVN